MVKGLIEHYVAGVQRWGFMGTLKRMYAMGELKFGNYMGQDTNGNYYYENTNYPYGQHRWVEYKDITNFDPSSITAEWHGWMHHMCDEPPTSPAVPKIEPTTYRHDVPFYDFVGLKDKHVDLPMNLSTWRQRGYKVGNLYQKAGEPEMYYKQPGHPSLQNAGRFTKQRHMESWNPKDPKGEKGTKPLRPLNES